MKTWHCDMHTLLSRGWIHADLLREEFMLQLEYGKDNRLET
jgi:hypothetical protein